MGKNQKGGKGHKRCKNNNAKTDKKLEFKSADGLQQYGVIVTVLGGCRFTVAYIKNGSLTEKLGVICGRMRKKVFIKRGNVVIISEREFEITATPWRANAKYRRVLEVATGALRHVHRFQCECAAAARPAPHSVHLFASQG